MPPRPTPKRTRRKTLASPTLTSSKPAPAAASSLSSSLSSSSAPPPPLILTSRAITRHQAKVSSTARQDYITFSSGIDGTLASSPSLSVSAPSSFIPTPNPRKHTLSEASQSQHNLTQQHSQSSSSNSTNGGGASSIPRSKYPRLESAPKTTFATTNSLSALTRSRARALGSPQQQTQGIASFMRQSKMSTSQKRSSPSTKSLATDADLVSSSTAQQEDSNGDMIVDSLPGKDTMDGKHQEQEDKPSNDQHADQTDKDHNDKE